MVTSRGGYLVVTFLLPLTTEYWALCLVQGRDFADSLSDTSVALGRCLGKGVSNWEHHLLFHGHQRASRSPVVLGTEGAAHDKIEG